METRFFAIALLLINCFWGSVVDARVHMISTQNFLTDFENAQKNAAPGDHIQFQQGEYPVDIKISNMKGTPGKPVIIEGIGNAKVSPRTHGFLIQKSAWLVIDGFDVEGGQRGFTVGGCNNITIRNCYVHDMSNYGIMNYRSSKTIIENNKIERSSIEHGIYVSGAANGIAIKDNFIEDTHVNGIHCNGKISSAIIEGNVLHRIGYYPSKEGGAGITVVGGASNFIIRNNQFVHIHGQGLTVAGPNVTIINNSFHDLAWSAILAIGQANSLKFMNNIVSEGKAVPLQVRPAFLSSFVCDYNYYVLGKQKIYTTQKTAYNLKKWQEKGFDKHSIQSKDPFLKASKGLKDTTWSYELKPDSRAVDAGDPSLIDKQRPPGLGEERSDMGAFGGPGNI